MTAFRQKKTYIEGIPTWQDWIWVCRHKHTTLMVNKSTLITKTAALNSAKKVAHFSLALVLGWYTEEQTINTRVKRMNNLEMYTANYINTTCGYYFITRRYGSLMVTLNQEVCILGWGLCSLRVYLSGYVSPHRITNIKVPSNYWRNVTESCGGTLQWTTGYSFSATVFHNYSRTPVDFPDSKCTWYLLFKTSFHIFLHFSSFFWPFFPCVTNISLKFTNF